MHLLTLAHKVLIALEISKAVYIKGSHNLLIICTLPPFFLMSFSIFSNKNTQNVSNIPHFLKVVKGGNFCTQPGGCHPL